MDKVTRVIKCAYCDVTEMTCGACSYYTPSKRFTDMGICWIKNEVTKECGYTCDEWNCSGCGGNPDD